MSREAALRRKAGCLTECVAYVFNLHPSRVPLFVYPRQGWKRRLFSFYRRRGYRVRWWSCSVPPKTGTHLVIGDSLKYKRFSHAVVYRDGKIAFDSNAPVAFAHSRITHRLVVRRIA